MPLTVTQQAPSNPQGQATAHTSEAVISSACLVLSGVLTFMSVVFWQVQALLHPLSSTIPSHFLEQWLVSPVDPGWLCTSTRIRN